MMSVGFNKHQPQQQQEQRILCDDEEVTLQVAQKKFKCQVGNLRKSPRLAKMFPEDAISMPANGLFQIDRNPEVFAALLEILESSTVSGAVDEEQLQEELAFWEMPRLEELDLLEEESCDTESDSPVKQVPSNVRVDVAAPTSDSRLDAKYSMRSDEMFGRAIALVRQEDLVVKVSDIQHGLALLRELLSIERANVSYMFYMAYGELRLGRTAEASYWVDRVLKIDPCNLAAASLKTLVNDRRKQNSVTGIIVVGGIAVAAAVSWFIVSKRGE